MTILEIKNLIFQYLKDTDTIILPDDFRKILSVDSLIVTDTPELHLEAFKIALKAFEDAKLLIKVDYTDNKKQKVGYILEKPLQTLTQTVELNGETCFYLASTLNSVRDIDDTNKSNSLSIESRDIEDLLVLAGTLIKEHRDNQLKKDLDGEDEENNNN